MTRPSGSPARVQWAVSPCCGAAVVSKWAEVYSARVRADGTLGRARQEGESTDGDPHPVCRACGKYVLEMTDPRGTETRGGGDE